MINLAVLGSTGSIGKQTLEVVDKYPDKFNIVALTAHSQIDLLLAQAEKFNVKHIGITNEKAYKDYDKIDKYDVLVGEEALEELAVIENADIIVTAVVGIAGLMATYKAIKKGKNIALANKESLVVAGEVLMKLAQETGSKILPVDSEHSAIFQCLEALDNKKDLNKIILTASGGPFRGRTTQELENVTVAQALNHPSWNMGAKITIDSATMMNKGLEVIEAKWLFGVDPEDIDVVIHPQSIIHSMVEFKDYSVLAQLGNPDMRLPILHAIAYPEKLHSGIKPLNLAEITKLEFYQPDKNTFRCLDLAYKALELGGSMPAVMNAANEVAVAKFLNQEIKFLDIANIIEEVMQSTTVINNATVEDLVNIDRIIRRSLV